MRKQKREVDWLRDSRMKRDKLRQLTEKQKRTDEDCWDRRRFRLLLIDDHRHQTATHEPSHPSTQPSIQPSIEPYSLWTPPVSTTELNANCPTPHEKAHPSTLPVTEPTYFLGLFLLVFFLLLYSPLITLSKFLFFSISRFSPFHYPAYFLISFIPPSVSWLFFAPVPSPVLFSINTHISATSSFDSPCSRLSIFLVFFLLLSTRLISDSSFCSYFYVSSFYSFPVFIVFSGTSSP